MAQNSFSLQIRCRRGKILRAQSEKQLDQPMERRLSLNGPSQTFLFAEILIRHRRDAGHFVGKFWLQQPLDFILLHISGSKTQPDPGPFSLRVWLRLEELSTDRAKCPLPFYPRQYERTKMAATATICGPVQLQQSLMKELRLARPVPAWGGFFLPCAPSTEPDQGRGEENDRFGEFRTGAGQQSMKETLARRPLGGK
jgi:hypothetical protein